MTGPIAYIGGKNRLAKQIIALFPEHTTYVEPFAGGAQVLFHKEPSKVEVLNDLDGDVVNFYRVCQWHHQELIRLLESMPPSRRLHELHVKTDPRGLTDIQRAARFLYLQKNSFGGLIRKQSFHYGVVHRQNYNPSRMHAVLESAHRRLQDVQVECLPYEEVLERYDRPTTLFYLDPPYYRRELYRHNFADEDFRQLGERLRGIKGRFILSLNDHSDVRQIFQEFSIRETDIAYTAQAKTGRRYTELLITNFTPRDPNTVTAHP